MTLLALPTEYTTDEPLVVPFEGQAIAIPAPLVRAVFACNKMAAEAEQGQWSEEELWQYARDQATACGIEFEGLRALIGLVHDHLAFEVKLH